MKLTVGDPAGKLRNAPGVRPGASTKGLVTKGIFVWLPLLLLTSAAFAQQAQQAAQRAPIDPNTVQIKIQKLTSNMYMLQFIGATGGNVGGDVAAFIGDDGIALVDCGYADLAPKLDAALKTISDKPVKYILLTHWHADHSSADAYFAAKSAVVVGHVNVRKHMQTGGKLFPPYPASELPTLTFSDQITLHINGGEIHGIHFPGGHTNGDTIYFFPQAHVVHMGDDFVNFSTPQFPAIDQDTDGSGGPQGVIAADEYALAHIADDVQVIPGHGAMATKEDMIKDLAVLKGGVAAVQAGIDEGKTLDQLKQENVLSKWNYLFQGRMKPDTFIERIYNSLTRTN